jgi:GNAT superfamily N-acetyltransferase
LHISSQVRFAPAISFFEEMMNIRDFKSIDYPSIVDIHNSLNIIWPEASRKVEDWVSADNNRSPKCNHRRFVAEVDSKIVGAASFGNRLDDYHPQKFYINIEVLEPYRNRGIGGALYDYMMNALEPFQPNILRTDILENQIQSFPFVQKRGFKEVWRETPVHLNISTFDFTPYESLEEDLKNLGIIIHSLSELQHEPDLEQKVFDLYKKAASYVPSEYESFDIGPFEDWLGWCLHDPSTDPDAFFIASHEGRFIALHELGKDSSGTSLLGGLLGTLPEYRGKGIALALMLRAIRYAQNAKLASFKTCTAAVNIPMQRLFTKLGFGYDPQWLQCQRDI